MTGWLLLFAVVATGAVFATTRAGGELGKRMGFRDHVPGAASSEDVAFLLSACGNDAQEAARRVEAERARFSDLTEAEHYRRAIRRVLAQREP